MSLPLATRIVLKTLKLFLNFTLLFFLSTQNLMATDASVLTDRENLDSLQREAFLYFWEGGNQETGLAYEADFGWELKPLSVGGTGFGVAALVVAADRGWITRDQAVGRLLKITAFLKKISLPEWHGAFPHWLNENTGSTFDFGDGTDVLDTVETSLIMEGLLIARAYFNGPGHEIRLRKEITELWEAVDWNFFTDQKENGIFWHWSPKRGFLGLRIKGYNEALITYVLAASSPTHPISRRNYNFFTSGVNFKPRTIYGYRLEASPGDGGPLFLSHYSFIGLNPHLLSDSHVPSGYFIKGVIHTLSNREYCLNYAPPTHRYSENFWGLTASQMPNNGYNAFSPTNDHGVLAPAAALGSMPYTPHYSMEVLSHLKGKLGDKIWGYFGPKDAISLKDNWVSPHYLAIDQLPIVSMIENYRTGLLWNLLMKEPEIQNGLKIIGLAPPKFEEGFPEAVVTLKKNGKKYVPDAYEIRRHTEREKFLIPFESSESGEVLFTLSDPDNNNRQLFQITQQARKGSNTLILPDNLPIDGQLLNLIMTGTSGKTHNLPLKLY